MLSLLTVTIFVFASTFSTLPLNGCSFLPAGGVCADSIADMPIAAISVSNLRIVGSCPPDLKSGLLLRGADLDQQRVAAVLGHVDDDAVADLDVGEMAGLAGHFELGLGADRQRLARF